MEPVKILSLELENVKRVRAVTLTPEPLGLTVIGGNNRQGKTSVLDGIAYALGGERFRPSNLKTDGALADPRMSVVLSNGLRVERRGKNSTLYVTDPTGAKRGQKLLDAFVGEFALDLPRFLRLSGKEKAAELLKIIGVEAELKALQDAEKAAFDQRTVAGRIADDKTAHAEQLPEYADAPAELLTAADLVAEVQAVAERNAARAAARNAIDRLKADADAAEANEMALARRVDALRKQLAEAIADHERAATVAVEARKRATVAVETPVEADESAEAIQAKIADLEAANAKWRANEDKAKALADAENAREAVVRLTAEVEAARAAQRALLEAADLPLPGLSVDRDLGLTYNGKAWDCMSSAEQYRVGVAIVRRLKPACGFVLLDGLEAFDLAELHALNGWLRDAGLQAIATRVSTGDECALVIEDGLAASPSPDGNATEPEAGAPAEPTGDADFDY